MILYADSSAVLAWLLEEAEGTVIGELLARAGLVIASDLTLVECDRAFHRASALGTLPEADIVDRRSRLASTAAAWMLLRLDGDVVARARNPFPLEPLRTLDALHIATALSARNQAPEVEVLALDHRLRRAAEASRLPVQPDINLIQNR